MAGHKRGPRLGRVDSVWHPIDLPPGLPHGDPGAELHEVVAGRVEGCPRVAAWSGYVRSTGCHTSPSVQDRDNPPPRRGARPGKPLTKNQVLGGHTHSRSEPGQSPRTRSALPYIHWYINGYGPPWTSSDPNPKITPDHGRICTWWGVLHATTDHMVDQLRLALARSGKDRAKACQRASASLRASAWSADSGNST